MQYFLIQWYFLIYRHILQTWFAKLQSLCQTLESRMIWHNLHISFFVVLTICRLTSWLPLVILLEIHSWQTTLYLTWWWWQKNKPNILSYRTISMAVTSVFPYVYYCYTYNDWLVIYQLIAQANFTSNRWINRFSISIIPVNCAWSKWLYRKIGRFFNPILTMSNEVWHQNRKSADPQMRFSNMYHIYIDKKISVSVWTD